MDFSKWKTWNVDNLIVVYFNNVNCLNHDRKENIMRKGEYAG